MQWIFCENHSSNPMSLNPNMILYAYIMPHLLCSPLLQQPFCDDPSVHHKQNYWGFLHCKNNSFLPIIIIIFNITKVYNFTTKKYIKRVNFLRVLKSIHIFDDIETATPFNIFSFWNPCIQVKGFGKSRGMDKVRTFFGWRSYSESKESEQEEPDEGE